MRTSAAAITLVLGLLGHGDASTDYIFANSFEIECDGGGCTYCSPANPGPVCGADSHCLPHVNTTSVCTFPAGAGLTQAACSSDADCAGPLTCADTGVSMVCLNWCEVPGGACPPAQTCTPFATPVFTGATEWGVCF